MECEQRCRTKITRRHSGRHRAACIYEWPHTHTHTHTRTLPVLAGRHGLDGSVHCTGGRCPHHHHPTPLSARAAWRGLMNSCSLDATPLVTDGLAWPGQAGRRRPQPNSRAALVDGHAHSQAETAGPPNTDPDHLLARHTRTGGV